MTCPFCGSSNHTRSHLPDTFFNNKTFRYLLCKDCNLVYLDPFPTSEDYAVMYAPTYQNGINPQIVKDGEKLPGLRFPYSKHFDIMRKFAPGKKILDYGCGQANFLINALQAGYDCYGTEYNPQHVEILRKEISKGKFTTIESFLTKEAEKYDVIRLSNVLEHLDDPHGIVAKLVSKLSPSGILLVEGPIETNANLAYAFRKLYFRLAKLVNKDRKASHPPTHIFFSNARNQRSFFRKHNLEEAHFEVIECEWPFPENLSEVKGPGSAFKWLIAKVSRMISSVVPLWGNTFIYAGRPLKA